MKLILFALALSGSLLASPINVFSTGTNSAGAPLGPANTPGAPSLAEIHFNLVNNPGDGTNSFLTSYISPYHAETSGRWIAPAISVGGAGPTFLFSTTTYVLEQAFDMTGLDINTAVLSGGFAADNCATIQLNNSPILASTGLNCFGGSNFSNLTPFTANSSLFLPGINTLRVTLQNQGGPGGVLVELTGTANSTIPEPATYALIGSALVMLTIRRKKA